MEKLASIPIKVSIILSSSPVLGRSVVSVVVDTGVTVVPVDAALEAVDAALFDDDAAALDELDAALELLELDDELDVEDAASAALPS